MTIDQDKLREVDAKLGAVRAAMADLTRLEKFLAAQREELLADAKGYKSGVSVTQKEVDQQIKRAAELSAKWSKPR